jgi:hypothetical protein
VPIFVLVAVPKAYVYAIEAIRVRLTCSALITSMMTPPFNILARPALTAKLFSPSCALWPFVVGSSVAIVCVLGMLEYWVVQLVCREERVVESISGKVRKSEREIYVVKLEKKPE